MEYNFDGKIHAINKDYASILKKTDVDVKSNVMDGLSSLSELVKDYSHQYAEYLYEFNKEKVIKILEEKISEFGINGCTFDEDYQFIYRPPWAVGALLKDGSFALKFKRAEKDNLDDEK